jgi:hypothetical protein
MRPCFSSRLVCGILTFFSKQEGSQQYYLVVVAFRLLMLFINLNKMSLYLVISLPLELRHLLINALTLLLSVSLIIWLSEGIF